MDGSATLQQWADWQAQADRRDPVELIEGGNADRLAPLVPIRRWRMSRSPFAFFRGAARIMAHDLATQPESMALTQLCGDAHLANFGGYASPERRLVFDLNDFDETAPGPFEWDLLRLAASVYIAARDRGIKRKRAKALAGASAEAYATMIHRLTTMPYLDAWYLQVEAEELAERLSSNGGKRRRKAIKRATRRDGLQARDKICEPAGDGYRIKSDPPLLVPLRDLASLPGVQSPQPMLAGVLANYRASLPADRQHLLDKYQLADAALKVVGVGSVGTRCWAVALFGRDGNDPLMLQVKQAGQSVIDEVRGATEPTSAGRRVVQGQQLLQTSSDIFLGWSGSFRGLDYYWRQLRDWKVSAPIEDFDADTLKRYGQVCGATLARAHARAGNPDLIAEVLHRTPELGKVAGRFAEAYADQNQADYEAFCGYLSDADVPAYEFTAADRG